MDLARSILLAMVSTARKALPEGALRRKIGDLSDRIDGAETDEALQEAATEYDGLIRSAHQESVTALGEARAILEVVPEPERTAEGLTTLISQSADGVTYRKDLVESAIAEGVRAEGETFDGDHWRKAFADKDLEFIKKQRDVWKEAADKRVKSGRKSTDEGPPVPTVMARDAQAPPIPDAAFQTGKTPHRI